MKKLLAFAFALVLVLSAAGCGGSTPSGDAPKELTVLKVAASPAPHARRHFVRPKNAPKKPPINTRLMKKE